MSLKMRLRWVLLIALIAIVASVPWAWKAVTKHYAKQRWWANYGDAHNTLNELGLVGYVDDDGDLIGMCVGAGPFSESVPRPPIPNLTRKKCDIIGSVSTLRELHLSRTNITDALVPPLSRLSNLEVLDLRDTGISDKGLGEVTKLRSLSQIGLTNTSVSDVGLSTISQLPLVTICARNTRLTDASIDTLTQFDQLTELDVSQCQGITDEGVVQLLSHRSLETLCLDDTQAEVMLRSDTPLAYTIKTLLVTDDAYKEDFIELLRNRYPDLRTSYHGSGSRLELTWDATSPPQVFDAKWLGEAELSRAKRAMAAKAAARGAP